MTTHEMLMEDQERGPLWYATSLVFNYIDELREVTEEPWVDYQVYVVFFSYTLGNWKATLSTSLPDELYFEATFDQSRNLIFLDSYVKVRNQAYDKFQLESGEFRPLPPEQSV